MYASGIEKYYAKMAKFLSYFFEDLMFLSHFFSFPYLQLTWHWRQIPF